VSSPVLRRAACAPMFVLVCVVALLAAALRASPAVAALTADWSSAGQFPDDSIDPEPRDNCRTEHNAALADDGRIWLFSGGGCWGYNEEVVAGTPGGGWEFVYPDFMAEPRWSSATARYGPHILKIGGKTNSGSRLIYRITPSGGSYGYGVAGELPLGIEEAAAAVHNGWLYVIGGRDAASNTGTTVYAAPVTGGGTVGAFRLASLMPMPRASAQAVVVRSRLYVIGGNVPQTQGGITPSASVIYTTIGPDGSLGPWQSTANLPEPVMNHASVAIGDDIYTIGGSTSGGRSDKTHVAEVAPATGAIANWQTASQTLPQGRSGHAAVAIKGQLVVTGGDGCLGGPCADAVSAPTDSHLGASQLLDAYRPELRYAPNETYRADSAATITDNCVWDAAANRAATTNYLNDSRGRHLAASCPQEKGPDLSLGYLSTYGGVNTDRIDESNDYASDAQRMHGQPQYRDKIYGRVVDVGAEGTILQYWLWYYNNPFRHPIYGGEHEGDWEMVQVHLDPTQEPQKATYAQHGGGEVCAWSSVEQTSGGRPVVYVGEGSHASFFRPGTDGSSNAGEHVTPVAEDITNVPPWLAWSGRWGGSDTSPTGPGHGGNTQKWHDPVGWTASQAVVPCQAPLGASAARISAYRQRRTRNRVPTPVVHAHRVRDRLVVRYRFARRAARPRLILTTVDPSGRRYPPLTLAAKVRARRGVVRRPVGLGRPPFRVYVSTVAKGGARSRLIRVRLR
jgi:hypothetical protein